MAQCIEFKVNLLTFKAIRLSYSQHPKRIWMMFFGGVSDDPRSRAKWVGFGGDPGNIRDRDVRIVIREWKNRLDFSGNLDHHLDLVPDHDPELEVKRLSRGSCRPSLSSLIFCTLMLLVRRQKHHLVSYVVLQTFLAVTLGNVDQTWSNSKKLAFG